MSGHSGTAEIGPTAIEFRIDQCGDSGLLVTFHGSDRLQEWEAARMMAAKVVASSPEGLIDVLSSFDSLFVSFDPVVTSHDSIASVAAFGGLSGGATTKPRRHRIPVIFGGTDGPELDAVAEELDMSPSDVISLYCESDWVVRVIGSPMGSPLLDRPDLPDRIPSVSRLRVPRTRLPARSLGVSGHQTVLYPFESPGGWQLIGRTTESIVSLGEKPTVRFSVGDTVRYEPVTGPQ